MGILNWLFGVDRAARGVGGAVTDVAEVFTVNKTKQVELQHAAQAAALAQFAAEFRPARSWFDALVDGINRLPRPTMAVGTIGLFAYAMADPVGFAERMVGLALVPDQLWWLLGAVVSFYFGARELHKHREAKPLTADRVKTVMDSMNEIRALRPTEPATRGQVAPSVGEAPAAEDVATDAPLAAYDGDWRVSGAAVDNPVVAHVRRYGAY